MSEKKAKGPDLNKWCMLGIKVGTKLYRKGQDKHCAITKSFVSMETQIVNGKDKKVFGGIALAERYWREVNGNPLKRGKKKTPEQGWMYFGILDGDNKWKSIYEIYKNIPHDVMRKRADSEEVENAK